MLTITPRADPSFLAATTSPSTRGTRSSGATKSAPDTSAQSSPTSATQLTQLSAQYSEMARFAVSAQFTAADASGTQLHFSFDAETQQSFLASIQQQISNAAANQPQSTSRLMSTSKAVQVRFQVSGSIMASFAKSAEQAAAGSGAQFNQWLDSVDSMLAGPDEQTGLLLELLDKIFGGEGKLQEAIKKFLQDSQKAMKDSGVDPAQIQGFQLEFEFEYESEVQVQEQNVQSSDPIVLDLNGDGISLTSHEDGAMFDITGSGTPVSTAFVTGGDAFLALDRNGNGRIDNGLELFGDQHGAANGFEELAKFDDNRDGKISELDKIFAQLLLFRDNGNGKTEDGELVTLGNAGIAELHLNYARVSIQTSGNNQLAQIAAYKRQDGSIAQMADALLNYKA